MHFNVVISTRANPPTATHQVIWRGIWGGLLLAGTQSALLTATFIPEEPARNDNPPLPEPWNTAGAALPIILSGTAFQNKVWSGLAQLCHGEQVSYRDLATRLGKPRAIRAVARAVAANPLPIILPCHRVVRADGKSGGYQAGAVCKRRLLDFEAKGIR